MIMLAGTWYRLPDGTRMYARAADAGAFRLVDNAGTLCYYVRPDAPSLFRLVPEARPNMFHAVSCDLTLDDLTPEPQADMSTLL